MFDIEIKDQGHFRNDDKIYRLTCLTECKQVVKVKLAANRKVANKAIANKKCMTGVTIQLT